MKLAAVSAKFQLTAVYTFSHGSWYTCFGLFLLLARFGYAFFDFFEFACLMYRLMRISSKRTYFKHIGLTQITLTNYERLFFWTGNIAANYTKSPLVLYKIYIIIFKIKFIPLGGILSIHVVPNSLKII